MKSFSDNLKPAAVFSVVLAIMMISVVPALSAQTTGALKPGELKALVANAKTPADHMKLARHYTATAEKHEAEAKEHETLAAEYAKSPQYGASKHPMSGKTAEHCKYYAEHCRKAAKEMRDMAAAHEAMAKAK